MKTERNNRIRKLREAKKPYSEIRDMILEEFGDKISRQRVHQITSGYKTPSSSAELTSLYENIKSRDNYACQRCDATDKPIVIHHKDFNASNNDPSNLSTLCKPCLAYVIVKNNPDEESTKNILLKRGMKRIEKIKSSCVRCEKPFTFYPRLEEKKYCSYHCFNEDRKENRSVKGFQYYMLARDGVKLGELSSLYNEHLPVLSREISLVTKEYDLPKLDLLKKWTEKLISLKREEMNKNLKKAKELFSKGMTRGEIAEEMGLCYETIRRYLVRG